MNYAPSLFDIFRVHTAWKPGEPGEYENISEFRKAPKSQGIVRDFQLKSGNVQLNVILFFYVYFAF